MILIKENHVRAAGGIRRAVEQSRRYLADNGLEAAIEVETRNLDEVREALTLEIDRVMLDNMTIEEIKEAIKLVNHQTEVEVSGGVNLENVREIALCGPDYISVGAITHSVPAFDYTLLVDE
jgi:nicotinate-nucleotide pyrophosphorylase (carboxylating)